MFCLLETVTEEIIDEFKCYSPLNEITSPGWKSGKPFRENHNKGTDASRIFQLCQPGHLSASTETDDEKIVQRGDGKIFEQQQKV